MMLLITTLIGNLVHPPSWPRRVSHEVETQAYRVDSGSMRWLSMDLPRGDICSREVQTSERFRHLSLSALDDRWVNFMDPGSGVLIGAQGLLMCFGPDQVRKLFLAIAWSFPGADMVFDLIPRITSEATKDLSGITSDYVPPIMALGLSRAGQPVRFCSS